MNKLKYLPIVAALAVFSGAQSSNGDRLGRYDFSYAVTADSRIRPAQVFDDGVNTYFQFRPGDNIPAIFAMTTQGPSFVLPHLEGIYVRLPVVAKSFQLRMGTLHGGVVHSTANASSQILNDHSPALSRDIASTLNAVNGMMAQARANQQIFASAGQMSVQTPSPPPTRTGFTENSYATPVAGDRVTWMQNETQRTRAVQFALGDSTLSKVFSDRVRLLLSSDITRIEVIGHDDQSYKEGLAKARAESVVRVLLDLGVDRKKVTYRVSNDEAVSVDKKGRFVQGVTINTLHSEPIKAVVASSTPALPTPPQTATVMPQTGIQTAPREVPNRQWSISAADETLDIALQRWARAAGWSVVNNSAPKVPIVGKSTLTDLDFLQAADVVITQARKAGFGISAQAFSNNTLVISSKDAQ